MTEATKKRFLAHIARCNKLTKRAIDFAKIKGKDGEGFPCMRDKCGTSAGIMQLLPHLFPGRYSK